MMTASEFGGCVCLTLAVLGVLANLSTLVVLAGDRKLLSQPSTLIVLALATMDCLYSGLILPATSAALFQCSFCHPGAALCTLKAYLFYAIMGCTVFLQARPPHTVLASDQAALANLGLFTSSTFV